MTLPCLSGEGTYHDGKGVFDLSLMPHPPVLPSSAAQIELLQLLVQIASENNLGEGVIVKIKFNIIASLYDYNPNLATYMKVRAVEKTIPDELVGQGWGVPSVLKLRAVEAILVVEGPADSW